MKIKEQESRQLEKSIEFERSKAITLIKQLEELNAINSQLAMQNADFKRRLVSLDLVIYSIYYYFFFNNIKETLKLYKKLIFVYTFFINYRVIKLEYPYF